MSLSRGGDSVNGRACDSRALLLHRKIARKLEKKPLPVLVVFFLTVSVPADFWRFFFNRRLRSRFDLTLPMQETLGEEGSMTGGSDLTEPDRLGNNLVFPGFRFFVSTKQDFCGFGNPRIEALDFLKEKR